MSVSDSNKLPIPYSRYPFDLRTLDRQKYRAAKHKKNRKPNIYMSTILFMSYTNTAVTRRKEGRRQYRTALKSSRYI